MTPEDRHLKVLIVEDQLIQAMDLEAMVEDCGCQVVGCAQDSVEAIEMAHREHPDLALIDLNLLDGPTGVDVARRLSSDEGAAAIFLTANPEQLPHDFGQALGAIQKPYSPQTVRRALRYARRFLNRRETEVPPQMLRFGERRDLDRAVAV